MKNKTTITRQQTFKLLIVLAVSLFALAGGAFGERAFAQEALAVFTYSMAVPTGDLKDFTNDESFRGLSFDYRFFPRDRLSFGFGLGWQNFSELKSGTFQYQQGTITVTGTQVRYATGYPFMGTAYLYTGDPGGFRLYGGTQAGLYYVSKRLDLGVYSFYEDSFQFGLIPEVGVLLPLSRLNLVGCVRYNYAFGTDSADPFSHFSFNIGFAPGSF